MNNIVANVVKAGVAVLALSVAAGCAGNKALDEVRATAQKAERDAAAAQNAANQASSAASAADRKADAAKAAADSAQSTANQALEAARNAQSGVEAANEKIDRSFKRSVSK